MKPDVLLVGADLARLVAISTALDPVSYGPEIAQTDRPLEYLTRTSGSQPCCAVIELSGVENVAEVHAVFERFPDTSFVFLIREMPPTAAMARAARHRAVFMAMQEPTIAIAGTLISLLAQRHYIRAS